MGCSIARMQLYLPLVAEPILGAFGPAHFLFLLLMMERAMLLEVPLLVPS